LASNLDLLIVPAFAFPAIPYDACSDLAAAVFETGLYNVFFCINFLIKCF